jgi:hypothetical protein
MNGINDPKVPRNPLKGRAERSFARPEWPELPDKENWLSEDWSGVKRPTGEMAEIGFLLEHYKKSADNGDRRYVYLLRIRERIERYFTTQVPSEYSREACGELLQRVEEALEEDKIKKTKDSKNLPDIWEFTQWYKRKDSRSPSSKIEEIHPQLERVGQASNADDKRSLCEQIEQLCGEAIKKSTPGWHPALEVLGERARRQHEELSKMAADEVSGEFWLESEPEN